jgi:uncharacterized membrane protein
MEKSIVLLSLFGLAALVVAVLSFSNKLKRKEIPELVLFLAGMSLTIGVFSYALNAYFAAKSGIITGDVFFTIITTIPDSPLHTQQISSAFSNGAQILMVTMAIAALCLVLWRLLLRKQLKG